MLPEQTSKLEQIEHLRTTAARTGPPCLLYGVLLFCAGICGCFAASFFYLGAWLFGKQVLASSWIAWAIVGSVLCTLTGIALSAYDLFVLLPGKRRHRIVLVDPPLIRDVTVVLTAYNDELSIGEAVNDFRTHPSVRRVIVVDNNSRDRTSEVAAQAGAIVVKELQPGYGQCVHRALSEGLSWPDTELTLLCEGDMTFRAYDIDKFLSYIPHADIVNGTRIVEQLRSRNTQLTTFMFYGNFFVGKLLEAKHVGHGTFTDVGTTYKLCRNSVLKKLLPRLDPSINLEFNAYFLDTAIGLGLRLVECPVTFHNRVGVSKGGNVNDLRAFKVGLKMIKGVVFSWGQKPLPLT